MATPEFYTLDHTYMNAYTRVMHASADNPLRQGTEQEVIKDLSRLQVMDTCINIAII